MLVQLKHLTHPPAPVARVIEAWGILFGFDGHGGGHSRDIFTPAFKHLKDPKALELIAFYDKDGTPPERVRLWAGQSASKGPLI
jgi:hypothetical protein